MRFVLLAAPLAISAAGPMQPPAGPKGPDGAEFRKNCRDRIELVREERGLPKLRRGTASPDEPLLIAAVDKRIDGCAVMVMRHDTRDVRPLPEFEDRVGGLMPAR